MQKDSIHSLLRCNRCCVQLAMTTFQHCAFAFQGTLCQIDGAPACSCLLHHGICLRESFQNIAPQARQTQATDEFECSVQILNCRGWHILLDVGDSSPCQSL